MRIASSALLLAISIFTFGASAALAQTLPDDDPINVTLTPAYPQPYQTVTLNVSSTLVDLTSSVITISASRDVISSGSRSASIQAGGPGSRMTVTVVVKASDGSTYKKQVVIAPSAVALIIEADSTAHPLYEGGALVAPEGRVRIVAIPDLRTTDGTRIQEKNLVYVWRLGERILEDQSGIGKSVLVASAPPRYRNASISVTVTTPSQNVVGSAEIEVAAASPLVRIYRHDPLLGVNFTTALTGTYTLKGDEDGLRAVPYFFANKPTLAWNVGGASGGTDPDVTLRQTGGGGSTALTLAANLGLENASTGLTIQFGQSLVNNLFNR